jgi:hypothetical protein
MIELMRLIGAKLRWVTFLLIGLIQSGCKTRDIEFAKNLWHHEASLPGRDTDRGDCARVELQCVCLDAV